MQHVFGQVVSMSSENYFNPLLFYVYIFQFFLHIIRSLYTYIQGVTKEIRKPLGGDSLLKTKRVCFHNSHTTKLHYSIAFRFYDKK